MLLARTTVLLFLHIILYFFQQEMASKQETDGRQMGYKCRIAGVLLLLLTSIAALIAVAVIQDTWRFKEYSLEVNTYTYVNLEGLLCGCRSSSF